MREITFHGIISDEIVKKLDLSTLALDNNSYIETLEAIKEAVKASKSMEEIEKLL